MLRDAYIGDDKVARIYTGEDVVHPAPVRDGLVLWYDFMGRTNSDSNRGIAEDLSGRGNIGTLMNFAYQPGNGYENIKEYAGRNLIRRSDDRLAMRSNNESVYPLQYTKMSDGSTELLPMDGIVISTYGTYTLPNLLPPPSTTSMEVLSPVVRNVSVGGVEVVLEPNVWTKISVTRASDVARALGLSSNDVHTPAVPLYYRNYKLEAGSEATPWRPAMEDPGYEDWAKNKGFKRGLKVDAVDDSMQTRYSEDLNFGKDDFSIEYSVTPHPTSGIQVPFSMINGYLVYQTTGYGWDIGHGSKPTGFDFTISDGENRSRIEVKFDNGVIWDNMIGSNTIISIIVDRKNGKVYFYLNGVKQSLEGNISHITGSVSRSAALIFWSLYGWRTNSTINSFKIYRKALTPEEIAHNYAMEKERWNL